MIPPVGRVPDTIKNFTEKRFFQAVKSAIEALTSTVNATAAVNLNVEDWKEVGTTGNPAFQNAWTKTANKHFGFRKLTLINCVHIHGRITPGTETDPTVIFALPIGYVPTTTYEYSIVTDILGSAGGALSVNSNGNVSIVKAVTTGTYYDVNIIFPLDV